MVGHLRQSIGQQLRGTGDRASASFCRSASGQGQSAGSAFISQVCKCGALASGSRRIGDHGGIDDALGGSRLGQELQERRGPVEQVQQRAAGSEATGASRRSTRSADSSGGFPAGHAESSTGVRAALVIRRGGGPQTNPLAQVAKKLRVPGGEESGPGRRNRLPRRATVGIAVSVMPRLLHSARAAPFVRRKTPVCHGYRSLARLELVPKSDLAGCGSRRATDRTFCGLA